MKRHVTLLAGCAVFALSATAAHADCAEELAQLSAGTSGSAGAEGGISKDGTLAPLQTEADAAATGGAETDMAGGTTGASAEAGGTTSGAGSTATGSAEADGEIAKDGSQAPLETGSAVATSAQDAQAQQEGAGTAAEQAGADAASDGDTPERTAALDRARMALESGDEDACMAAVEEARSL